MTIDELFGALSRAVLIGTKEIYAGREVAVLIDDISSVFLQTALRSVRQALRTI